MTKTLSSSWSLAVHLPPPLTYLCAYCYILAVHRHTLKQVYGRLGIEKIDLLLSAPSSVVPEVISSMKSKLSDYYDSKGKFLATWSNVPREHYPLSLNDRGSFFKKKDKANRQPIGMDRKLSLLAVALPINVHPIQLNLNLYPNQALPLAPLWPYLNLFTSLCR